MIFGNSYIEEDCELPGCKNDAQEMKIVLEKCNFEVSIHLDSTKIEMQDKVDSFAKQLKSKDHVLFYFSGHGLTYQGQQLLVPCHMEDPENEFQIQYRAFSCQSAIDRITKHSSSGLKIIITDCCRVEYEKVLKSIGSRNGFSFHNVNIKFEPNKVNSDTTEKWPTEIRNIVRICATSSAQAALAANGNALSIFTRSLI